MAFLWVGYFVLFIPRPFADRQSGKTRVKALKSRDRVSLLGIILQFLAVFLILAFASESRLPSLRNWLSLPLAVVPLAISWAALRRLGNDWSMKARIREGHRLVTQGPFQWVRHPLYLAFFLLTAATGLAFAGWKILFAALMISIVGMTLRIRVEERILQEEFGEEYERYACRVPALIPFASRRFLPGARGPSPP